MQSSSKLRVPEARVSRGGSDTRRVNTSRRESRRGGGYVVEIQRRRLLGATSEVVYERGAQGVTAALVTERAGVSRKTFYDIFSDREGCLAATFQDAVEQATEVVKQTAAGHETWSDRVRAGLTGLLSFLDVESGRGRLLVVEALAAGDRTLQARRRVLAQIVAVIEQGRRETTPGGLEPPPLTGEGVVGAVLGVIHERMLAHPHPITRNPRVGESDHRPLVELTGQLMAMIVHPYLGPTAAQSELHRPLPTARYPVPPSPDPFKDLSIRLTHRTAIVLRSIAANPGASNKQIAKASGITDDGQTSKLLTRLEHHGLIKNTDTEPLKGQPRAWSLTKHGEKILQAIGQT